MGVHVSSIKRWESGKRFPDPTELQALSQALGEPIRELFTFPDRPDI